MRKLKRFMAIILVAVITLTFAACGTFKYDKDAAVKKAESVADVANTKDYQAVYDLLPKSMQAGTSADKLKSDWDPMLAPAGAFKEYKSCDTASMTQNGVKYIVTIVTCKFENSTLIYTISFTTDMEIAGLFLKPGA